MSDLRRTVLNVNATVRYLWREERVSGFAADTWTDVLEIAREKRRDPYLDQDDPGLQEWLLRAAIVLHLVRATDAAGRSVTLLWGTLLALLTDLVDRAVGCEDQVTLRLEPDPDSPARMLARSLTVASNAPGAAA